MQQHKTELRRRIIHRLQQAAAADPTGRRSAALRALLAPLISAKKPLNIAIYAPLPHEVNLMPLLRDYPQHHFVFPRCGKAHSMSFHLVTAPEVELQPGAMGIPAPQPGLPVIPPEQLDIVIVPGVGFSLTGKRLGYGGGYYDRYLPRCTRAQVLALAFPEQIEDTLPTDEHDFPIPSVLTNGF
ncbi:MAG: 5-formyltetrahydrofolate cyclo-ligase [Akkermansia sp.]|nr:5-formyltetrahydrofolate cyclo-ligase [Akkermansia sp.]